MRPASCRSTTPSRTGGSASSARCSRIARASAYLFSPWGNLLDVRPAKTSLASADAFAAEHDVRPPLKVFLRDFHALVEEADAAGFEFMDVRSDGERGSITNVAHGRPDEVVYDGDALAVDAILYRLWRGSFDSSHGADEAPRVISYLGRPLPGMILQSDGPDHVRLHLQAGRARNLRVLRSVFLSDACWSSLRQRGVGSPDATNELVVRGLRLLGDGPVPAFDPHPHARVRAVLLDSATDAAVLEIATRQGTTVREVVESLLLLALDWDRRDP